MVLKLHQIIVKLGRKGIGVSLAFILVLFAVYLVSRQFYRADVQSEELPSFITSEWGTIWGKLVDPNGSSLSGVNVIIGYDMAVSDSGGYYSIPNIVPGVYTPKFIQGDKVYIQDGRFGSISVAQGASKPTDFTLIPADTGTTDPTTPEPPTPPEPPADEQPGTVTLTANSQASSLNISSSSDVALSWNASVSTHQCSLTQLVYDQSDEKTEVLGDKTRGASGSETISGLKYPAYFRVFCAKTLAFGSDNLPQANDKTSSSDVHVSIQSSDPNPGEVTLTANNLADTVIIPVGGGVQLKWNYIGDGTSYGTCRLTQTVPVSSTQTKTTIIANVAPSGTKTMTNINTETTYTIACGRGMATGKVRVRF